MCAPGRQHLDRTSTALPYVPRVICTPHEHWSATSCTPSMQYPTAHWMFVSQQLHREGTHDNTTTHTGSKHPQFSRDRSAHAHAHSTSTQHFSSVAHLVKWNMKHQRDGGLIRPRLPRCTSAVLLLAFCCHTTHAQQASVSMPSMPGATALCLVYTQAGLVRMWLDPSVQLAA
jgi:hypothetical protein